MFTGRGRRGGQSRFNDAFELPQQDPLLRVVQGSDFFRGNEFINELPINLQQDALYLNPLINPSRRMIYAGRFEEFTRLVFITPEFGEDTFRNERRMEQIRNLLSNALLSLPARSRQVYVRATNREGADVSMSTSFLRSVDEIVGSILQKVIENTTRYEDSLSGIHWYVKGLVTRFVGSSNSGFIQSAVSKYIMYSPKSKRNCIPNCVWTFFQTHEGEERKIRKLTQNNSVSCSADLVRRIKKHSYILNQTVEDFDIICKYYGQIVDKAVVIHHYDNNFKFVQSYGPYSKSPRQFEINLRICGSHCTLMLDKTIFDSDSKVWMDCELLRRSNTQIWRNLGAKKIFKDFDGSIQVEGVRYDSERHYIMAHLDKPNFLGDVVYAHCLGGSQIIKPLEPLENKPFSWGVFDCETVSINDKGSQEIYAIGFTIEDDQWKLFWEDGDLKQPVHVRKGGSCIEKGFDWMFEQEFIGGKMLMFSHNGGKFDMMILFGFFIRMTKYKFNKVFIKDGKFMQYEIKLGDKTIIFKDSLNLFPGSLSKLCKSLNTKHKKKDDFSIGRINMSNYNEHRETILDYLKYDVLSLWCVCDVFNRQFLEKYKISPLRDVLTAASLSCKILWTTFMHQSLNIYKLDDASHKISQFSFFGGRNYLKGIGYKKNVAYIDVNGLYAFIMGCKLFHGLPEIKREVTDEDDGLVVCRVWVFEKDMEMFKRYQPFITFRSKDFGNINAIPDKPTVVVLQLAVFRFLEKIRPIQPYQFEIITHICWKTEAYLKPMMTCLQNDKLEGKRTNNPSLCEASKLVANSTFGKMAQKEIVDKIDIMDRSKTERIENLLKAESLVSISDIEGTDFTTVCSVAKVDTFWRNSNVASQITSLARIHIFWISILINQMGEEELYSDTDSCIFTLSDENNCRARFQVEPPQSIFNQNCKSKLFNHLDQTCLYEYIDWNDGGELGFCKDELSKGFKPFFKDVYPNSKISDEERVLSVGDVWFGGPKMYLIETKAGVVKSALRGLSRGANANVEKAEFFKVYSGDGLIASRTQFLSGKPSIKSNTFGVDIRDVTKKFKTSTVKYDSKDIKEGIDHTVNFSSLNPPLTSEMRMIVSDKEKMDWLNILSRHEYKGCKELRDQLEREKDQQFEYDELVLIDMLQNGL